MKVKVDTVKNRLYLKISGDVSKKALDNLYTDVRFAVADLQPGFSVINDLTECNLCHITGVAVYKKITQYLVSNGVREVVRIINKDSLVLKQFLNFASRFSEYIPIYVNTIQEAEEKLDKSDRRNRLRFRLANLPPVEYVAAGVHYEGHILDISTGGCKIGSDTLIPALQEEIELILSFNGLEMPQENITIKACVVKRDSGEFIVEYTNLGNEEESLLWQCLQNQFEHDSQAYHSQRSTVK
jgi:hypothetical protein